MKCDEIFAALAMLEKERGIPQSFMMGKIIQALTTAYKRDHEGVEYVVVDVDEEKKDLKMYVQKEIVEEVENPGSQISLEEAKRISAKNELGGMVNFPVESVEFGRIAAGNGKQVIIQGLREAEHGMIYDEWGSKQHEILTGTVSRIDPRTGNVSLRIGTGAESTEAVLTMNEQVPGEELREGQYIVGDLVIDYNKHRAYLGGEDAGLTPSEFKILALLGRYAGRVLTYQQMLRELWGPAANPRDNKLLRVHMANLRRKLEKNPEEPRYLFTEVGVGYRLAEGEGTEPLESDSTEETEE